MLEIRQHSVHLNRRQFLQLGAAGAAGLSLSQAGAAPRRADTAVILFWMAGGPSHIDTYDMKPNAPAEVRGPFAAVPTRLPGFRVNELMPRHAALADRLAIIRSLHHSLGVHDDASHWVQTGVPLLDARQRGQQAPAQGAVVARLRGASQAGVPAYVCIPEGYSSPRGFYQRSAYLGARFDPVNAGGDPALGNYRRPDFTLPADVSVPRLEGRQKLLQAIDRQARHADASGTMDVVQQAAFDLMTGPRARRAFDLDQEPATLRDKYGRHAYGQAALLARRLVEAGTTFVTINLYEADVDWWDDHYVIEKNLRKRLPRFDQAVGTLIEDLLDRGQFGRVLVAAFGEFGRNPLIDKEAGRGHWPRAMSAMLAGGGLKGGQIVGSTVPNGGEPYERPLLPGDLLATMYRVLGIDHEAMLLDKQNRPIRLVEPGQPIAELF